MAASTYKRSEDKKTQMAQRCKSGIRTGLVVGSNQAADLCLYQEREGKGGRECLQWTYFCDVGGSTVTCDVRPKVSEWKSPNGLKRAQIKAQVLPPF